MRVRSALLAALLTAGAIAGVAEAATVKKSCNLVTDDKGDSSYRGAPDGVIPGTDSTDLTGGDIASDKTRITAIIRVAALSTSDSQSPFGQAWFFTFVPRGLNPDDADSLFLGAYATPTGGEEFYAGYRGDHAVLPIGTSYSLKEVTGVFDTAKNEIRITAPIADFGAFAGLLGKGKIYGTMVIEAAKLAGQRAVPSPNAGGVVVPVGGLTLPHDEAEGSKTYISGAASCVAIGK